MTQRSSPRGMVAMLGGDPPRARDLFREALALTVAGGWRFNESVAHFNAGLAALADLDLPAADASFEDSLSLSRELGDAEGVAYASVGLAGSAAGSGDFRRALQLLNAADELLRSANTKLESYEQALHDETLAAAVSALAAPERSMARAEGLAIAAAERAALRSAG